MLQEFAERIRIRTAAQRIAPEFVEVSVAGTNASAPDNISTVPATAADSTVAFDPSLLNFGEVDGPTNLLLNEDATLRAASLVKLIEKMSSSTTDVTMIFDFLLTYRTYATPMQLLAMLKERFRCPPPPDRTGAALIQFTTEQTIVRLKVVNIVKHWIERNWYDWVTDEQMPDAFSAFIDSWVRSLSPCLFVSYSLVHAALWSYVGAASVHCAHIRSS